MHMQQIVVRFDATAVGPWNRYGLTPPSHRLNFVDYDFHKA